MSQYTLIGESAPQLSINEDIHNFADYTCRPELWHNGIPHVFKAIPVELDPAKSTVIIISGTSGAGKDTVIDETEKDGIPWAFATTGTSRGRRVEKGEPEDKYIWFRPQREDETWEQYKENMIIEYRLIEADEHYGNFYGLPLSSLQVVLDLQNAIPMIRTDVNGALTISQKLAGICNIVTITILPDSIEQVYEEVRNRALAEGQDPDIRIKEDLEKLELFTQVTNFYLLNSRKSRVVEGYELSGLHLSVNATRRLLEDLGLIELPIP